MLTHELDRLVASGGLADDLVALLLEELLEIEPDDRFVLGDHDACGRSACLHRSLGRPGLPGRAGRRRRHRVVAS